MSFRASGAGRLVLNVSVLDTANMADVLDVAGMLDSCVLDKGVLVVVGMPDVAGMLDVLDVADMIGVSERRSCIPHSALHASISLPACLCSGLFP